MRRWLALVAWLLLLPSAPARADSLHARFEHAVREHAAGRPEEAAAELRDLVRLGIDDPDVYRNLGVAEADATRYGHAMVAFERCLGLRPGDEVAQRGLENAETMLARRRAEASGSAETVDRRSALLRLGRVLPERTSSIAFLVSIWLFAVGAAVFALTRREGARIAAAVVTAGGLLGGALFGLSLVGRSRRPGTAPAIVVAAEVDALSAPDPRAPEVGRFVEGERVDVIAFRGTYVRIAVEGRPRGFVPRSAVGTY